MAGKKTTQNPMARISEIAIPFPSHIFDEFMIH